MEGFLEKTVQMFSYLTDKDLFAEIYRWVFAVTSTRVAGDMMQFIDVDVHFSHPPWYGRQAV